MTRKQFTDILMKQILTIITTIATALIILAFKAPFLFKKNVETELGKKADKVEMYEQLEKKTDKTLFEAHIEAQKSEYQALQSSISEIRQDQRTIITILRNSR